MKKLLLLVFLLPLISQAQIGSEVDWWSINHELKLKTCTSGTANDSVLVWDPATGKFYERSPSSFGGGLTYGQMKASLDSQTLFYPSYYHAPNNTSWFANLGDSNFYIYADPNTSGTSQPIFEDNALGYLTVAGIDNSSVRGNTFTLNPYGNLQIEGNPNNDGNWNTTLEIQPNGTTAINGIDASDNVNNILKDSWDGLFQLHGDPNNTSYNLTLSHYQDGDFDFDGIDADDNQGPIFQDTRQGSAEFDGDPNDDGNWQTTTTIQPNGTFNLSGIDADDYGANTMIEDWQGNYQLFGNPNNNATWQNIEYLDADGDLTQYFIDDINDQHIWLTASFASGITLQTYNGQSITFYSEADIDINCGGNFNINVTGNVALPQTLNTGGIVASYPTTGILYNATGVNQTVENISTYMITTADTLYEYTVPVDGNYLIGAGVEVTSGIFSINAYYTTPYGTSANLGLINGASTGVTPGQTYAIWAKGGTTILVSSAIIVAGTYVAYSTLVQQ